LVRDLFSEQSNLYALKGLSDAVELIGYHSLSNDVVAQPIRSGGGLIGWVARHGRSIHVSPFEHDSRTLGIYSRDQQLKSFIGIPIIIPALNGTTDERFGVVACDSKKSYAFSKLQGKLLEDLAETVSCTILLGQQSLQAKRRKLGWDQFVSQARDLAATIGADAIDTFRLRVTNFEMLEGSLGTAESLALVEQVLRLIEQALPPHTPVVKLPNGDLLIALDNMMLTLYQNKILTICERISNRGAHVEVQFVDHQHQTTNKPALKTQDTVYLQRANGSADAYLTVYDEQQATGFGKNISERR
jgi:hypothetical protein